MDIGKQKHQRLLQYDLLRIAACFSVIMLHSSSQFWYDLPVTDHRWIVTNSYNAMFRFGVPVFVMISGALFLAPSREISLKRLYTHNIVRLATAYIVWSCAYGLWDAKDFDFAQAGWKPYLLEMLFGSYHLWYVPMLIGIYMLLPVLRTWVTNASRRELGYFLFLFFVFQIGKETLLVFVSSNNIRQAVGLLNIDLVCGYAGYFILGYYIAHIGIPARLHKWIYMGGAAGLVLAVAVANFQSVRAGEPKSGAFDSFSLFTFFVSAALFLLASKIWSHASLSRVLESLVRELSAATFGIYLMHILVLERLNETGFNSSSINNLIGIPLLAIVCFLISYAATAVLRRIPVIGKFIC